MSEETKTFILEEGKPIPEELLYLLLESLAYLVERDGVEAVKKELGPDFMKWLEEEK